MSGPPKTDREKLDWLQLIRCENVGPRTFKTLLDRHGDAAQALAALPEHIRRAKGVPAADKWSGDPGKRPARMGDGREGGACFIALGEPDYPAGAAGPSTCRRR